MQLNKNKTLLVGFLLFLGTNMTQARECSLQLSITGDEPHLISMARGKIFFCDPSDSGSSSGIVRVDTEWGVLPRVSHHLSIDEWNYYRQLLENPNLASLKKNFLSSSVNCLHPLLINYLDVKKGFKTCRSNKKLWSEAQRLGAVIRSLYIYKRN